MLSDYKDRPEGVRVKHRAYGNSINVYDKGGSILRIETTINHPESLASLDTSTPLGQLAAQVCRPVRKDGKRYRALRPWSEEDRKLLEAISPRRPTSPWAGRQRL